MSEGITHHPERERKVREFKDFEVINKMYWTITEVSEILAESNSALRFWESRFDWIIIKKGKKGNRVYTSDNIASISNVLFLNRWLGVTEAGIKQAYELGYFERLTELAQQEQRKAIENEIKNQ